MKNNSIAPFYVGQEVVVLMDAKPLVKGEVKKVLAIWKHCCVWMVDVGLYVPGNHYLFCRNCGTPLVLKDGDVLPCETILFAPIQSNFEAISFEKVLEQELSSVN